MKKSILFGCVATLAFTGVAQAQINVIREPLPEYQALQDVPLEFTEEGVMKAQHIRPGDVSPEEYQALLDEADRVRGYQYRDAPSDYTDYDYKYSREAPVAEAVEPANPTYVRQLPLYEAPRTQPVYAGQTESYISGSVASRASYYVVKGDTLYGIARKHGIAVADLKVANDLRTNMINQGQFLEIPVSAQSSLSRNISPTDRLTAPTYARSTDPLFATTPTTGVYAVLPGDTMYSISRRACVRVDALQRKNASVEADDLQPGQRLAMPAGHCL